MSKFKICPWKVYEDRLCVCVCVRERDLSANHMQSSEKWVEKNSMPLFSPV